MKIVRLFSLQAEHTDISLIIRSISVYFFSAYASRIHKGIHLIALPMRRCRDSLPIYGEFCSCRKRMQSVRIRGNQIRHSVEWKSLLLSCPFLMLLSNGELQGSPFSCKFQIVSAYLINALFIHRRKNSNLVLIINLKLKFLHGTERFRKIGAFLYGINLSCKKFSGNQFLSIRICRISSCALRRCSVKYAAYTELLSAKLFSILPMLFFLIFFTIRK